MSGIDVLVGADASGFKSFGGELLVFVGDHVYAERELVDIRTLATEIKDSDFGIGHTTVEPGLWVWLSWGQKSIRVPNSHRGQAWGQLFRPQEF